ncbi:MAG: WYL domain-containing protein, partial [Bacteroidaceae bacterium]|nr:WYL domain-containing protein [Bacteroidaceae bacterium]
LKEKRKLRIKFKGHAGNRNSWICIPYMMEYSSKDNKFRLITANQKKRLTINIERIHSCKLLDCYNPDEYNLPAARKSSVELELWDQRNALERVMLHFSHFEKQVERISDNTYRLHLNYERDDETELVIRILSFGPVLRVIEPKDFKKKISERIEKQMKLRA